MVWVIFTYLGSPPTPHHWSLRTSRGQHWRAGNGGNFPTCGAECWVHRDYCVPWWKYVEILTTGNFATSNPFSLCLYTHARKKENLGTSSTHSFDVLLSIFPFRSSQPFGFVTMQPAKFNPRRMLISSHADIRPKFGEFSWQHRLFVCQSFLTWDHMS